MSLISAMKTSSISLILQNMSYGDLSNWIKQTFMQAFVFEHNVNRSNVKVSTHYQIIGLYSEGICYDVSATNKFCDFF